MIGRYRVIYTAIYIIYLFKMLNQKSTIFFVATCCFKAKQHHFQVTKLIQRLGAVETRGQAAAA